MDSGTREKLIRDKGGGACTGSNLASSPSTPSTKSSPTLGGPSASVWFAGVGESYFPWYSIYVIWYTACIWVLAYIARRYGLDKLTSYRMRGTGEIAMFLQIGDLNTCSGDLALRRAAGCYRRRR